MRARHAEHRGGPARSWAGVRVRTVGHSTRTSKELIELLRASGVRTLVDVRTIPRSRHNPQSNLEALRSALPRAGLRYVHMPALGGLRHARPDSINTGWHNASFRGYADYMQTEAFAAALHELREIAAVDGPICVMCAEAVPWHCHRTLLADALVARGAEVEHIMGPHGTTQHHLTPFAHVEGTRVTYPLQPELPLQPG